MQALIVMRIVNVRAGRKGPFCAGLKGPFSAELKGPIVYITGVAGPFLFDNAAVNTSAYLVIKKQW